MELRDLIITPIFILLIYIAAYLIRPYVTDETTKKYFFPALTVRLVGAIALGFIYQFYYSGGDTFNFHSHGSRHIWEAFWDSPGKAFDMFFSGGKHSGSFFKYSSRIYFFSDQPSFFVIRFAGLLDLLTFSTYSATAALFAVFSFTGAWMLFITFYNKYPNLHKWMAVATLFIPSVFFWGSGILKDTLVLSSIGIATYELDRIFIQKKFSITHVLIFLISMFFIFSIKKFVLQAFLPSAIIWIYFAHLKNIQSVVLKILLFPFVIGICTALAYYAVLKVGEGDVRYEVELIGQTARTTAVDILYLSGKDAGSGYTLGQLDGSFGGMLKLAPQAINVALFRPYIWEVKNPLMLISAIESVSLLFFTVFILFRKRLTLIKAFHNPDVVFSIVFSLVFAFAVGASTYNFGTLARYKIPLLPFFLIALILIYYSNNEINEDELEETE